MCYTAVSCYFVHSHIDLSLWRETVYWFMLILMSLHMSAKVDPRGGGSSVANSCLNVVIRGNWVSCIEESCIVCVVESAQSLFVI